MDTFENAFHLISISSYVTNNIIRPIDFDDDAKRVLRTERPLNSRTIRLSRSTLVRVGSGIPFHQDEKHSKCILYCSGLGACVKDPAVAALKFLAKGTFGRFHQKDNTLIISYWNAYDNDHRFNFGGPADVSVLNTVFRRLLKSQSALERIILYGSCVGSKVILHFLHTYANDPALSIVKASVLDSPPLDLEGSLTRYMRGLYTLTRLFYFRHYVPHRSNPLQFRTFPKHVALFWSAIEGDRIADVDDVRAMATHVSKFLERDSVLFIARREMCTLSHMRWRERVSVQVIC